ncbi:hypothetical protein AAMO2058_001168500 [Amorphochlora amoebiformis]
MTDNEYRARIEYERKMVEQLQKESEWRGSLGKGTRKINGSYYRRHRNDSSPANIDKTSKLSPLGVPPPPARGRVMIREWQERGEPVEEAISAKQEIYESIGRNVTKSIFNAFAEQQKKEAGALGIPLEPSNNRSTESDSTPHNYTPDPSPVTADTERFAYLKREFTKLAEQEIANDEAKNRVKKGKIHKDSWKKGFLGPRPNAKNFPRSSLKNTTKSASKPEWHPVRDQDMTTHVTTLNSDMSTHPSEDDLL